MFKDLSFSPDREISYQELLTYLDALIDGIDNTISNLANASALLNYFLEDINWVGFYLYDDQLNELLLGPFQGLPACTNIPLGKGVCGVSAERKETIVVPDVHEFPGHIACDARSQSEIVVPLFKGNQLHGVLDIDSPLKNRFDEIDKVGLIKVAELITNKVFK